MTCPTEDASAQKLSNITIPDSPEDMPRIDHFGDHQWEYTAKAPAGLFHAGITLHDEEEVMEQGLSEGERESSDSSEESDPYEGSPQLPL